MPYFFHTTLHPAMYHGHKAKPPFFEGWYFKLIDQSGKWRFAIIPGVILGEDAHAFIQVLDGVSGLSEYHRYDIQDFHASKQEFHVWIGANEFTQDKISLDIDRMEKQVPGVYQQEPSRINLGRIKGELIFSSVTPWPVTMSSPGIMGWYAWVPFMECYHGVVSLDHNIIGELTFDKQKIDFSQGSGYIEKDWGKSFPDAWIWFQTNHFQVAGTSLTGSIGSSRIKFTACACAHFVLKAVC